MILCIGITGYNSPMDGFTGAGWIWREKATGRKPAKGAESLRDEAKPAPHLCASGLRQF